MTVHPPHQPPSDEDPHSHDGGWVSFTVGDALRCGWRRFWANALTWIPLAIAAVVIGGAVQLATNGFDYEASRELAWPVGYDVGAIAAMLLTGVVNWLLNAVLIRGALDETYGRKATFGGVMRLGDLGAVLVASLLVAVGITVGTLLLVIPGLVVLFLTYYTLPFVLDKDQDAITAIRSSVSLVTANAGRLLLLTLAVVGINIVGGLLCGIGLLVTIPVTTIATTYAFRVLQGERVPVD